MASRIDFSFTADNVPAPEPSQTSAREGRRTTASGVSANLFGCHHFDLDTVEVIFDHNAAASCVSRPRPFPQTVVDIRALEWLSERAPR